MAPTSLRTPPRGAPHARPFPATHRCAAKPPTSSGIRSRHQAPMRTRRPFDLQSHRPCSRNMARKSTSDGTSAGSPRHLGQAAYVGHSDAKLQHGVTSAIKAAIHVFVPKATFRISMLTPLPWCLRQLDQVVTWASSLRQPAMADEGVTGHSHDIWAEWSEAAWFRNSPMVQPECEGPARRTADRIMLPRRQRRMP